MWRGGGEMEGWGWRGGEVEGVSGGTITKKLIFVVFFATFGACPPQKMKEYEMVIELKTLMYLLRNLVDPYYEKKVGERQKAYDQWWQTDEEKGYPLTNGPWPLKDIRYGLGILFPLYPTKSRIT